ncbi:MAG: hypothetical protein E7675_00215 [Ruminococcaceae bacterium]|nr:hypothetical protein [Oscillospiraceae bacterium]
MATLLLIALSLLVSCESFSEEKQMEMKTKAEIFVDCLMKKDVEKAFDQVNKRYISKEDFYAAFPQMIEYLGGFSRYNLTGPVGYRVKTSNGVTYAWMDFLVETDNRDFYIEVGTAGDSTALASCNVSLKDDVDVASGKPFANIIGKSPLQIVVLAYGVASLAFVVLMVIDCARKNIKKKALWIVVIILGQIAFIFNMGNGVSTSFNLGFYLTFSALSISENISVLRLIVPVGAIIYMIRRKRLVVNEQSHIVAEFEVSEQTCPASSDNGLSDNCNSSEGETEEPKENVTEEKKEKEDGNNEG